jgi:hypothetical protein
MMYTIRKNINCKECGNINPKGRRYCSDMCVRTNLLRRRFLKRKLKNEFTNAAETQFLIDCMSNGIDTTGKIQKEYISLGKKPRSVVWLIKKLKQLGIYKEPNMDAFYERLRDSGRQKRLNISQSKGFSIVTNHNKRSTTVRCNECGVVIAYKTMLINGCYKCRIENIKIETKKRISDKQNKKKLVKNTKYNARLDKLKEFVYNARYTEYDSWNKTPVHKEYVWYNQPSGINYKDKELDYKIQCINYYEYKVSNKCPDTPKSIEYKICNKCREHKIKTNFVGHQCKECAKEYRREFLSSAEKLRMQEKYKNDPVYKLDSLLRVYIHGALKGTLKTKQTREILGIGWGEFREYIEERFEDWMNWDNHGKGDGKWALQHIVPRSFASNEDEIYLLNYHKNLMPMCAVENGILKNRILKPQLNEWHNTNKEIQTIIKRNKDKLIS